MGTTMRYVSFSEAADNPARPPRNISVLHLHQKKTDENGLLGYDRRLPSANQSRDAASSSPASLTLLAVLRRVGVCSDINDC
ncbi:hypothetical protein EYF80_023456 [Liparis tanakae]|uniref:Uncharacterized protein n=1 Tax=Liparis tanakae TaxID=230148 RepID=A0A4Z2HL92_9TELE|nr:hypothetical protein EYF80_023456 [Liparis tanakae]